MLGIYIHFPYCVHKCFYCDFYSLEDFSTIDLFADSLIKEIEIATQYFFRTTQNIDTIYFGGGTPSLINPLQLEKIFNQIAKFYNISDNAEITLEANPGTIDQKYLRDFKSLGVNRLSIGMQSFIDEELKFLQRIHTAKEAIDTFNLARSIGFDNISIDIMYNLPIQTIDSMIFNANKAIELSPEHISAYSLIYEPDTPLQKAVKRGQIHPLNENIEADGFLQIIEQICHAGYEQYEISNFAKDGKKSRHNSKYWTYEPYISFGPSAHSFLYPHRHWNIRSINKYIEKIKNNELPIQEREEITPEEEIEEKIMLGLRANGVPIEDFKDKYSIDLLQIIEEMPTEYQTLFQHNNDKVRLTKRGYLLSDEIIIDIISKIKNQIIS